MLEGRGTEPATDDRYVVLLRSDWHAEDEPQEAEKPLGVYATYGEAHTAQQHFRKAGYDCVIRFDGPAGGGD
jgi:hypothetical protein